MAGPFLSVVIPTRSRHELLRQCLRAAGAEQPPTWVEFVVCDDSPPGTTGLLSGADFPGLRVVRGPGAGPGAARNAGAAQACGDWLVFVDDDCVPAPGWLSAYREAARCHEAAKVVLAGATTKSGAEADSILWEAPEYTGGGSLPPSCNFALPAALFRESGGFDERYRTSFEDIEFFARLQAAGVEIVFLPQAGVLHPVRPLPGPGRLADRWEARVVSCYDLGAQSRDVLWRLPRHVAMVLLSRFRGRRPGWDEVRAGCLFAAEFALVLARLPGWIRRHHAPPHSPFWTAQRRMGKVPPNFGL